MTGWLRVGLIVPGILACTAPDDGMADAATTGEDTAEDTGDPPPPPPLTIFEIAQRTPELSTLVGLLEQIDLDDALSGDGPFTVFAPVDAAFADADSSDGSDDELLELLRYHVIADDLDATSLPVRATSLAALTLFFDTESGVRVNDASVLEADIDATNGVIHLVDTVLVPPDVVRAVRFAGLTELDAAIAAADPSVIDALSAPEDRTLFAPTDAAFGGVTVPTTPVELAEVLLNHALPTAADADSIPARADSMAGLTLFFDTTDGVTVNQAMVQEADIATTNGIVHIIDDVLLPPDVLTAAGYAGLSELSSAVAGADPSAQRALAGQGPLTLFAPIDSAFQMASPPTDPGALAELLLYHAAPGAFGSATLPETVDSVSGPTLFFDTSGGGLVNDATLVEADIRATNGVLHLIDGLLAPPELLDVTARFGLTELGAAVGMADPSVLALLSGDGPVTLLAPTNAAFQSIPGTITPAELTDILLYHALVGVVDTLALPAKADSSFANDFGIPVSVVFDVSSGVRVNGVSMGVTDVRTRNGIVHVIDDVLLPPRILELASLVGLNSFVGALSFAPGNLADALSSPGPFTVFAPTDAAFAVGPTPSGEDLTNLLLFHIADPTLATPVRVADLTTGELVTALTSINPLDTLTVDASVPTVGGASLVLPDVNGLNGTLHVIDEVLVPPSFP
ncbi:MAG: fasciclin domain-containing protein [Myxococcota bacterium]